ncbi:integral membrane protein GPR180 [Salmo salar]|uniref:Integral membrane protein GPR180 n=1 Tax=Salmo salar TaxID=8030 RepID=A0A1S3MWD4_SALSA|nr:integral membrane protein GPR180-like [Salmo salar]|eukprot:XP_014007497.1 PREDICTED: integral membrane protein GPR180-like [Salmo salar]
MYPLMFTLTAFLLCIPATFGKTVSGVFKSDAAREQNGQYITKFMYNVGSGLVVCRLENATLAVEKESRLLLFPETEDGFDIDNLSCHDRLSKAQLSIRLREEEHNQSIPHLHSPTAWMALYADRYTCGEGGIIPAHGDLTFTILLFNPDSAGNPLEHFSAEEAGLHSFYCLLILAYFVASCIYIQPLWMALRKGGPMHTVLKVLSTALALQGISALFNYIHLARYARDGVGIPIMGSLAEFCDMVSQVSMLYMLLSLCVGWTLSKNRKPQSRPLQWDSSPASKALAMGGVATQGALLLWEQYEETEHHSYHAQRSIAGLLLISLRIILALLLASVLYTIISTERSALKRDFYLSFAKGCFIWFLCHPVLVLLSVVFNEHQREKVVTIGVILCQAISVVILYQLFLSRSLYWEVSSLSSVSLPLTMSRGVRGRY